MLYCEPCSFRLILEPDELPKNLVEIKTSSIPSGIPTIDSKTGKVQNKPSRGQSKKYKCPRCGRGIVLKELQGAYCKAIDQLTEQQEKEKEQKDKQQRLEDGKPPEKILNQEL